MKRLLLCSLALLLAICTGAQNTHRDRYVVIVSFDGFRHDYIDRNHTPAFDKMAKNGVRAVMLPCYPASTFPNHYAMATGLVPDHNGIVNNSFWDPEHKQRYSMGSDIKSKSYFYLGEPLWNTVQRQGLIAGITYWVGSEFNINGSLPKYYLRYVDNEVIPFERRVKRTIDLLSLPEEERPRLLMVYFSEPDHTGHIYGPDHRNTDKAVRRMDKILGRLRNGLADLPIADKIDLIVVSDHGMTGISPDKCVSADKYLKKEWMEKCIYGTPTSIFSKNEACRDSILNALKGVGHLHVWKKEEVPAELDYGTSPRLGDIIVAPELGWRFSDRPGKKLGGHGYFPSDPDMQMIFRAEGPDFKKGYENAKFRNVTIYTLACHLLGIEPAPNDGDLNEVKGMLAE